MAKAPTLPEITTQHLSSTQVNTAFQRIEDSFANTLSLDGSTPNELQADLDLNGQDIINANAINASAIRINGVNLTTTESLIETPSDYKYTFSSISNLLNDVRTYTFWAANDKIVIDHYNYTVAATGASDHHLTTAGGVKLYITDNVITPAHFGATPDVLVNQGAYIQSAIDLAKASRISSFSDFSKSVSLEGKLYYTTQSINLSGIRQPGFHFGHGTIYGACAGKIVLDIIDSNTVNLSNLKVIGDETARPSVGVMVGRNTSIRIAPSHDFFNIETDGYFDLSAYINGGSEDMRQVNCSWVNQDHALTAFSAAIVGHGGMYAKYFPTLTSDFQALPTVAYSHISHSFGFSSIRRPANGNADITGITIGANAVITVDPADLASTGWVVGTLLFVDTSVGGMEEIWAESCEITAINTGTGQITTDYDSSGHTAYTSGGRLWGKTGPGLLIGSSSGTRMQGHYILTYGSPSVILETGFGNVDGIDLTFQQENNPRTVVRVVNDTPTQMVIKQFKLNLLSASQITSDQIFSYSGDPLGSIRFDNFSFTTAARTGPTALSSGGVFNLDPYFSVTGAALHVNGRAEAEVGTSLPDDFEGTVYAYDDKKTYYVNVANLVMSTSGATIPKEGVIRYSGNQLMLKGQDLVEREVLVNRTAATAAFTNIANVINTQQKYQGKPAYNTTTNRPVWASGSTAGAVWVFADGTTAHTPV